jgi:hypothetical protein
VNPKQPAGPAMTLGNNAPNQLLALLAFTPLNLAFDRFSQHMRAFLKSLQHVIDASDCPDLQPQQGAF